MKKAIRDHLRDFVAIIGLFVIAAAITLVILNQQRLAFPAWVPGLGEERFELQGEFSTAQAVMPGQGQSVNIAGVKVGDVSKVELVDGHALVTMSVDEQYAPLIHRDATMLLRPKTGLQDMTIELDPGTAGQPIDEGTTVPLAQTQPNVNPDQFLASLDADTRDYLTLLLQGGGEGLKDRGVQLSAGLRRFEPTVRDIARFSSALAKRRQSLRHVIHEFRLVSEELGSNDTQLAEFVDASNAALAAFANQEASIRGALRELPSALESTNAALQSSDRFGLELGPALERLRPSARALGPALEQTQPFFRDTVGPIRNQIRPFTRKVQPTIRHLKPAAQSLRDSTPALASGLDELNHFLNAWAFNPSGPEEGYLFWASWFNHNLNSIFLTQDPAGPLRRGIILESCFTANLATGVLLTQPFLHTVQQLTNLPLADDLPDCP